ncbi:dTDP-4-dehydrorhamnose reductase [Streptomyces solincola]|nr:dTDP-4-dehydrorhamnose reductase [Streptomyces solincola]
MTPADGPVWLVTGADGMLARDLLPRLGRAGVRTVAVGRSALDVTDPRAVREVLRAHRPALVVNCAAWTAVDEAEEKEAEAHAVNARGPRLLAEECGALDAVLLHVSTDYVFGGDAAQPYPEDAPPAPRTAYGRGKLAGERAVLQALPRTGHVVRTAWLFGEHGRSFVRTMIALARGAGPVEVVDDQRGQPTWTGDLADHLLLLGRAALAGSAPPGIYHGTSGGDATWFELAAEVFALLGADVSRVRPVPSDRFPRPAARPAYSVLGHDRWREAGIEPMRHWREALAGAWPEMCRAAAPAAPSRPSPAAHAPS